MADMLAGEACTDCRPGTPPLSDAEAAALASHIDAAWQRQGDRIRRRWRFKNFAAAFDAASTVAGIAEDQGHHPDLRLGWGYLEVDLTTHAAHGLTRNDFILAARIDAALPA